MLRLLSCVLSLTFLTVSCSRVASAPAERPPQAQPAAPSLPPSAPVPAPAPAAPAATWILTTPSTPFAKTPAASGEAQSAVTIQVDPSQAFQSLEGFGGAFNEQGWDALGVLSEAERDGVMRALFDRDVGLRFNYCRVPIGASDYALSRYSLDEGPDDYNMTRFSIERDKRHLIPYIRAAQKLQPNLRLWGSAWSPPTWMKTNRAFDGGAMRDEPKVYAAYALYLAKFVESYRGEGLPISMVVPQNEPSQLTNYPSCDWSPAQYIKFIRDHLAPTFRNRNLDTRLYVGSINKVDWDVFSVLKDPGVAQVVSGVALQWHALLHAAPIHAAYPQLTIMQSETECGNHHWEPGFNPDFPQNDFTYAARTFRKFRDFIRGGASSYMLWNMVLDERGKNIDAKRPWPQNSAVVVDRKTKRVTYTPMFWVTKHFSGLVEPGARLVASQSQYADQIAFQNPDGSVIVELLNEGREPVRLTVVIGQRREPVELPPQSVGSLIVPRG